MSTHLLLHSPCASSSPSCWSPLRTKLRRHVSSHASVFGKNDRVLLRHVSLPDKIYLSQPLEPGKSLNSHFGFISHSDIIGRRTRDVVATNKGTEFRLTWPTVTTNLNPSFFHSLLPANSIHAKLDDYVTRVRRLVTPVSARIFNLGQRRHANCSGSRSTPLTQPQS